MSNIFTNITGGIESLEVNLSGGKVKIPTEANERVGIEKTSSQTLSEAGTYEEVAWTGVDSNLGDSASTYSDGTITAPRKGVYNISYKLEGVAQTQLLVNGSPVNPIDANGVTYPITLQKDDTVKLQWKNATTTSITGGKMQVILTYEIC